MEKIFFKNPKYTSFFLLLKNPITRKEIINSGLIGKANWDNRIRKKALSEEIIEEVKQPNGKNFVNNEKKYKPTYSKTVLNTLNSSLQEIKKDLQKDKVALEKCIRIKKSSLERMKKRPVNREKHSGQKRREERIDKIDLLEEDIQDFEDCYIEGITIVKREEDLPLITSLEEYEISKDYIASNKNLEALRDEFLQEENSIYDLLEEDYLNIEGIEDELFELESKLTYVSSLLISIREPIDDYEGRSNNIYSILWSELKSVKGKDVCTNLLRECFNAIKEKTGDEVSFEDIANNFVVASARVYESLPTHRTEKLRLFKIFMLYCTFYCEEIYFNLNRKIMTDERIVLDIEEFIEDLCKTEENESKGGDRYESMR